MLREAFKGWSRPLSRDKDMRESCHIPDSTISVYVCLESVQCGLTMEQLSASTSSHTHTATIRPPLTHTSSASSIHLDANSISSSTRNHYVTPGITERTMTSTASSTGRRLGGLSRFGGPARRVIPPPEEPVDEDENCSSPVLTSTSIFHVLADPIDSPRIEEERSTTELGHRQRSRSPEVNHMLRRPKHSPPRGHDPYPSLAEVDEANSESLRDARHRLGQSVGSVVHRSETRTSPQLNDDRPFRPFQRYQDQENQPEYKREGAASRLLSKDAVPHSTTSVLDRPPPQPLKPAHIVPGPLGSSPVLQITPAPTHALIATRPAPSVEQLPAEYRSLTQTAPVPQVPHVPLSENSQQSATLPTQAAVPGKRSFLVRRSDT